MIDHAIIADNSKNMEALRNARSFNDAITVLTKIKTKANAIKYKANKNFIADESAPFTDNTRKLIGVFYKDLFDLSVMELEVVFAKSLDDSIINEAKQKKYKRFLNTVHNSIIDSENQIYATLKSFIANKIPSKLDSFVGSLHKFLLKTLKTSGDTIINLPSSDAESYESYIIFNRIYGPDGYIMTDTLFKIKAITNRDGSFSYSLSFPSKIGQDDNAVMFSSKAKLLELIKSYLIKLFNVSDIKQLSTRAKRKITRLAGVHNVTLESGILNVVLKAGLTAKEINGIITKLLYVLTTLLNITDVYKDVIHKMTISEDGTKTIQFTLMDRNFYNINALSDLKKLLNLKPQTYEELKLVAGAK